jgi:hypothetical protein
MPYRPLSHNERILVKLSYQETSSTPDEICEHLIYVLEKVAEFKDLPAFEVHLEKEKRKKQNPPEPFPAIDTDDPDYLKKLADAFAPYQIKNPINNSDWLFGDPSKLSHELLRLTTLFFNSKRYRRSQLDFYIQEGFLTESDDFETIERVLKEFDRKHPGTRNGLISSYEIYFGDPSQFSYQLAKSRMAFLHNPDVRKQFLLNSTLPLDSDLDQIKSYLLEKALSSGHLKQSDVDAWEGKVWD